ncbi:MAG: hypothetical protein ACKVT0_20540 [Planctomycetaceae bacterium]
MRLILGVAIVISSFTSNVAWSQFTERDGAATTQPGKAPAARKRTPPPGLPAGFVPPRPVPEVTNIEKELLTAEEEKAFKPDLTKYQRALTSATLSEETRVLITRGIKFRLLRMTRKVHRPILHLLRNDILYKDLAFAKELEVRTFFLEELTKASADLLDNNFHVRLNVVLLLGNLKLTEENEKRETQDVAFTPALEVLLKVFDDKTQLEAIKIPAVHGLQRICQIGTPNRDQRLRVAEVFVSELNNIASNAWYQMRLAEGLGWVGIIHDRQPRPFVVQTLATVLVDEKRDWQVRAQAARALGRAPLDGSINVSLISYAIVDLAAQGTTACNQAPPGRTPYWIDFYLTLYLSFQPETGAERKAGHGLILRNKPASNPAYEQILTLVNHILDEEIADKDGKRSFSQEQVDAIVAWLENNPPNDPSVAPGEKPIMELVKGKPNVAKKDEKAANP